MKTLPIEIKKTFFETKEQYLAMRSEWAKRKIHTAAQHLLYAILRGTDWSKGFSPVTNQIKIANGQNRWSDGASRAHQNLRWSWADMSWTKSGICDYRAREMGEILSCFGGIVNEPMVKKALEYATKDRECPYQEVPND